MNKLKFISTEQKAKIDEHTILEIRSDLDQDSFHWTFWIDGSNDYNLGMYSDDKSDTTFSIYNYPSFDEALEAATKAFVIIKQRLTRTCDCCKGIGKVPISKKPHANLLVEDLPFR